MDTDECIICFGQMDVIGPHAQCKQCFQMLHLHCARTWIQKNKERGCPFCRYTPRREDSYPNFTANLPARAVPNLRMRSSSSSRFTIPTVLHRSTMPVSL